MCGQASPHTHTDARTRARTHTHTHIHSFTHTTPMCCLPLCSRHDILDASKQDILAAVEKYLSVDAVKVCA